MRRDGMVHQRDALTELVQQHVGTHTSPDKMTVLAFTERAVDPDTGYRPSRALIGKMVQGQSYGITPQLVGAIAVGLGLPCEVVGAAAHLQFIGYTEEELESGTPATLLRKLGTADV